MAKQLDSTLNRAAGMWAITSFYNPAKYRQRAINYRAFRRGLAIPLITVELSFDGGFELNQDDADILVQIRGSAMLWQKERLLNLALTQVPDRVEYVAYLDCDVMFEGDGWVLAACSALSEYSFVQLFSERVDLPPGVSLPSPDALPTGQGIISALRMLDRTSDRFDELLVTCMRRSSFGLAWATHREFIQRHSFYDAMIIGSGDRAMVCAMIGRAMDAVATLELNPARAEHYLRWAEPIARAVRGRVGSIAGTIHHLWHGDPLGRRYRRRHNDFARFEFDPFVDIRVGPEGAWEWTHPVSDIEAFLRDYFRSREEDSGLPTAWDGETMAAANRDTVSAPQDLGADQRVGWAAHRAAQIG